MIPALERSSASRARRGDREPRRGYARSSSHLAVARGRGTDRYRARAWVASASSRASDVDPARPAGSPLPLRRVARRRSAARSARAPRALPARSVGESASDRVVDRLRSDFVSSDPRASPSLPSSLNSAVATKAKYGDESVYFDLSDPESTTGSWDVYGQDATARYPGQQEEFFEKAAQGLGRREAMYSFLALAGPAACLIFGAKGAKDANLPITVGPQKEPVKGPRDRL